MASCTLTNTPITPEHCVLYIKELEWDNNFKHPIDTDNIDHITWIYEQALGRSKIYGIEGVTIQQTLGNLNN